MKVRRWDNAVLSEYFYLFPFIAYVHQRVDRGTFIITTERGIYFGWLKYVFYIPMEDEE
jgi:hypothetical protein